MPLRIPTADEYAGLALYGNDFTADEILEWFEDEAHAYADLTGAGISECGYLEWARRHAYRHLPDRRWRHVLAFGAASGAELVPLADRAERITIVESHVGYPIVDELRAITSVVLAEPSGTLALTDESADLIVCFGVLHHIPNVSHVLAEFGRVASPDAWLLLREPIHSMGDDWTRRRPGLTPHERGIPLAILMGGVRDAGFAVKRRTLVGFPPITMLWRYWKPPYNSRLLTLVDLGACRAFSWNLRYMARRRWEKFRPTSAALVACRVVPADVGDDGVADRGGRTATRGIARRGRRWDRWMR